MTQLKNIRLQFIAITIALLFVPLQLAAAEMGGGHEPMDLTTSPIGFFSLILFVIAYFFVMAEEFTHLRKSKPVILAAGIIWVLVALAYTILLDLAFRY